VGKGASEEGELCLFFCTSLVGVLQGIVCRLNAVRYGSDDGLLFFEAVNFPTPGSENSGEGILGNIDDGSMPIHSDVLTIDTVGQLGHDIEVVDPGVGRVEYTPVSPTWGWRYDSVEIIKNTI